MSEEQFGVALFHTTSQAIKAESVMKRASLKAKLVPVPRNISSDCGAALRFALADVELVRQALADGGVETSGFHTLTSGAPL